MARVGAVIMATAIVIALGKIALLTEAKKGCAPGIS
jgi:hypothetical protein